MPFSNLWKKSAPIFQSLEKTVRSYPNIICPHFTKCGQRAIGQHRPDSKTRSTKKQTAIGGVGNLEGDDRGTRSNKADPIPDQPLNRSSRARKNHAAAESHVFQNQQLMLNLSCGKSLKCAQPKQLLVPVFQAIAQRLFHVVKIPALAHLIGIGLQPPGSRCRPSAMR